MISVYLLLDWGYDTCQKIEPIELKYSADLHVGLSLPYFYIVGLAIYMSHKSQ